MTADPTVPPEETTATTPPASGRWAFLRGALAALAGLFIGGGVIMGVEMLGHLLHPPPKDLDVQDRVALAKWVATLPATAHFVVLTAWGLGTFAGAWLAARVARSNIPAMVVGVFLMAGGVQMLVTLPHPLWMSPGALIVFPAATFAGARLATVRRSEN